MTTNTRRPIIAGNWKMVKTATDSVAYVRELAQALENQDRDALPDVVLCPPFTSLASVRDCLLAVHSAVELGSQNISQHAEGAYTGEISADMLLDVGCDWVIIGHSERRTYYGETDASVNAKTKVALERVLTPIVCVGETLEQREAGQTDALIREQVKAAVDGIAPELYKRLVFAYEPVWAIGTGKTCAADEANRVCALIRTILAEAGDASKTRILYGGSVKAENAQELMAQSDIDGALVGGASLTVPQFLPIIQAGTAQLSNA